MKTNAYAAGIILLLVACSKGPVHTTPEQAVAALDLITIEALKEQVAWLADDAREGRDSGTQVYDDSAAYVAEQLEAIGVEPGGVDGWYQPVTLRTYKVDTETTAATIHRHGEDIELVYRDDFGIYADSVREETSVRAEVVYVGHGVHAPEFGYSDYDGIDVNGKVVALFRGAPEIIEGPQRAYYASGRTKSLEAVSRGAVGYINLRSRSTNKRYPWESIKNTIGKRASMTWVSDDGRAAGHYPEYRGGASFSPAAAEKLFGVGPLSFEQALDANEAGEVVSADLGVEVSFSARHEHDNITSPNVIGLVRGTDPDLANEYIVYTAHLDHVGVRDNHGEVDEKTGETRDALYNGAYDNAMGIALMLETARAIAAAPPKRSVLFIALTAEEKGLLGSDFFANNPTVSADSMVANVNLDMPLFLYPPADLVAFGSQHTSLQDTVEEAAADEGFFLSPDPLPEENLFVRSDQYSFVKQGVPAVYLMPGFTSADDDIDGEAAFRDHLANHYHKPSDDMTRPIHWESALRFARAQTRIGYAIGNDAERPVWNEGDFFGEKFGRN